MVIAVDNARKEIEHAHSLAEIIPWLAPWDHQTVLCKDRGLLAVVEYFPKDYDGISPEEVNVNAEAMERMLMKLRRDDIYLWFTHTRRKESIPVPETGETVADAIAHSYYEHFTSKNHYRHRHFLSVLVLPPSGPGKFVETFKAAYQNHPSVIASMATTFKTSLGFKAMDAALGEHLENQSMQLEKIVHLMENSVTAMGSFKRLQEKDLWGFLNQMVTPTEPDPRPIALPRYALLDSYLGMDTLQVTEDALHFSGPTQTKDVAVFSIKGEPEAYPEHTQPGMLDVLYQVDAEWTLSFALRMTDVNAAKNYMKKFRSFYNNTRKNILSAAGEAITEQETENINDDADVRSGQTSQAIKSFATGNALAAYTNISILVYGDKTSPLNEQVDEVYKALTEKEFTPLREHIHALSAWAGTLPGQWALPVRWIFLTGSPIADLIPVHGIYTGRPQNDYLSEQLNTPIPALAKFETKEQATFDFNFHVADLGHTLVAGPSRSGKSAFVNFLISQWMRYPRSRVFVFDKDQSNLITCLKNGGVYMDYASEDGMPLNPIQNLETASDVEWLGQWLEQLLSTKEPLNSEESIELAACVQRMMAVPEEFRRLSVLGEHFTGPQAPALRNRLAIWTTGIWAKFFSAKEDKFQLSRYTTIAMDEVTNMELKAPARAFLSYMFHRIEKSLDGSPTLIYLEEAWFAFEDPVFSDRLKQWLKRLAKKNVIVVMATQSAFESQDSASFSSIIDNVPTLILLPHPKASTFKDFYRKNFQIDPYQVEELQKLTPKRDYYVIQNGIPKVIQSTFDRETLAYLRSDSAARDIFKRWQKSGDPEWRARYVQEAQRLG